MSEFYNVNIIFKFEFLKKIIEKLIEFELKEIPGKLIKQFS
jgi:hypothetical protein